ncbi:MAG: hypothetical protein AB7G75_32990, partial [Candidatus Binatia bacterium]
HARGNEEQRGIFRLDRTHRVPSGSRFLGLFTTAVKHGCRRDTEVLFDTRKFMIVFFEDLAIGEEIPEPLNTILVTILVAYRIRWEVIEYFLPRMLRWTDEAKREKGCEEIIRRLTNIEQAAEFQRYISPDQLHESFKDAAEEEKKIQQIYDKWWALRENLDSALLAQDIARIHSLFQEMLPVHEESVRVTAKQFMNYVATTYGEVWPKNSLLTISG